MYSDVLSAFIVLPQSYLSFDFFVKFFYKCFIFFICHLTSFFYCYFSECDKCPRTFKSKRYLRKHLMRANCLDKQFKLTLNLSDYKHESGKYCCKLCKFSTAQRSRISRHLRFYSKDTPQEFKCVKCKQGFTSLRSCNYHLAIHIPILRFCEHCGHDVLLNQLEFLKHTYIHNRPVERKLKQKQRQLKRR